MTELATRYLAIATPLAWWRVCEPPDPLSEAELAWIWAGQRFPPEALAMPNGRRVRVLNPGRPNGGPGPDFRDAVVSVDGEECRGDVELHVRASAFRGHGHHVDPAYDGVALHVVYRADAGASTPLSNGALAPVAAFAPWLEERSAELQRWLAAPALWQEPCRSAEQRLGPEAVETTLREAGERRFAARIVRVQSEVAALGETGAVWLLLFEALGQGNDRAAFRRLAGAFPPALAARLCKGLAPPEAEGRLAGALLAVAGLISEPEALRGLLPRPLSPALPRVGRPANRPERRLAAFAALYRRAGGDFAGFVSEGMAAAGKARELVAAWQVAAQGGGPALLGEERARELVLNVVLPFAAVRPELRAKALGLLAQLPPSAAYGKTAFLEANLRRTDGRRRVRSALAQQGLLAFLGEWCSRGGCGKCPLS